MEVELAQRIAALSKASLPRPHHLLLAAAGSPPRVEERSLPSVPHGWGSPVAGWEVLRSGRDCARAVAIVNDRLRHVASTCFGLCLERGKEDFPSGKLTSGRRRVKACVS